MPAPNAPARGLQDHLVRALGWNATILHGDPTVVDRWRWLRRHLRAGPLRTLDAGCGSGAFTMYAAMQGNRALGIADNERDIDKACRRAELLGVSGVDFVAGDLRRLDEFGESLGAFDQVLLFECIEHILNDDKLVADLAARMKPGATILLTTPYRDHRPLFGERTTEVEDGGHVRFGYTHDEVAALFERHGIEVVAREYIGGLVAQKLASMQFALCRVNPYVAWAATFPFRVFHPLDGPLTRLTRYPHLSIGVVGRKRG
ncbi:MAG TPA: class I SAM-dependent methyltransferase [Longimicrobiaceae bacterium]|nr:class I SAM-dependent methyltransferase [Longimicrobiaceae bacterium]